MDEFRPFSRLVGVRGYTSAWSAKLKLVQCAQGLVQFAQDIRFFTNNNQNEVIFNIQSGNNK